MSSAVETSLLLNSKRFLDFARNDRSERVARTSGALSSAYCGASRGAKSQFDRALENKLGRAGKRDIGETLTVAAKIDI